MSATGTPWLTVRKGSAPLLVSIPHTGTWLPPDLDDGRLVSRARALRDADWWIDTLYDYAADLGATIVHTAVSRTVIDVNRDPSGQSLYPGQATTGLCPTTTFAGEPLYHPGREPDATEIAKRRDLYWTPYHVALDREVARLRALHPAIVLYDCHSIVSVIPRLFEGELPHFNIGTYDEKSCAPDLTRIAETACDRPGFTRVTNGRFKGGWITRSQGRPEAGVHAVQMELACRAYMRELGTDEPAPYDPAFAAPVRQILTDLFTSLIAFANAEAAR